MLQYYQIVMDCMIASTFGLIFMASILKMIAPITPLGLATIFFLPNKQWKRITAQIMMLVHWFTPTIPANILFGRCSKLRYRHNQFPPWFPFSTSKPKQRKCK